MTHGANNLPEAGDCRSPCGIASTVGLGGGSTVFDTEPDFVNELGTKWWRDESTTHYAQRPDIHGITIDAVCFYVEDRAGLRTRVLVSKSGEIIEANQSLEALAAKIDLRKFLKRDDVVHPNNQGEAHAPRQEL